MKHSALDPGTQSIKLVIVAKKDIRALGHATPVLALPAANNDTNAWFPFVPIIVVEIHQRLLYNPDPPQAPPT